MFNNLCTNTRTFIKMIFTLFIINIHSIAFLLGVFFINLSSFLFSNILGFLTIGLSLLIIALLINRN